MPSRPFAPRPNETQGPGPWSVVLTRVALVGVAAVALECRSPRSSERPLDRSSAPAGRVPTHEPYVVVLGVAQDGGYPQLACDAPLCVAARRDPSRARHVASLLLVDPRDGARWLFDATPDLAAQVELARPHGRVAAATEGAGRPALFEGIFLTHAHAGHYLGLWQLGREAYGSATTPVHGTERMARFLRDEAPWSLLVDAEHIAPKVLVPGRPVMLRPDLRVTAIEVPHRAEFTDTVAYVIEGPSRSALFLPDIDKWERFETPIEQLIAAVDVAYLDATFFDGAELPGRDMAQIPHPFVVESLARLAPLAPQERSKVRFLHLNHSNPLLDPMSAAARTVRAAGLTVAEQGEVFKL
ncbi:MAG: MBL fold metallo-hydrolase [Planctomycetota bacterium]